jgi:D-alanine-D-alanine ligase
VVLHVLQLTGSPVDRLLAELSLTYARGCADALAAEGLTTSVAHVEPGGSWRFPTAPTREAVLAAAPIDTPRAVGRLVALSPDIVVPQMFCRPGMTAYRGLLDVLQLPYVGNPPGVMALAADKAHARAVVAAAGVPVPRGEVVRPGDRPTLAPPVVVKPVDCDNSVGVSLVRDRAEYPAALAGAFHHADAALVESYVELGREVRCATLERDDGLLCLPLEEYAVQTATKPVRDAADKLSVDAEGGVRLMAKGSESAWTVDPADPVTGDVHDAARRCHVALGCRDYGLFDFRIDPAGRPWFLEAGPYCSFSPASVIVMMAAAAGIGLPDLFADLTARAWRRRSR